MGRIYVVRNESCSTHWNKSKHVYVTEPANIKTGVAYMWIEMSRVAHWNTYTYIRIYEYTWIEMSHFYPRYVDSNQSQICG